VLALLNEWLVFEPSIITLYIGWNHTIARADPRKNDVLYDRFALYRLYYHAVINRADLSGYQALPGRRYDLSDPELQTLRSKTFAVDLEYLHKIILKIRAQSPSAKIMLLTLPGLYTTVEPPDRGEIEKGYATAFSSNLAAWSILSERYNEILRTFARKEDLVLVDLAKYAEREFRPRSQFFADSVHPSRLGYSKIAEILAESIKNELPIAYKPPAIKKRNNACGGRGARPDFVNIAPLLIEFAKHAKVFETFLIQTCRHYDFEMSGVFSECRTSRRS
jgi:lysophospholipase L1-like esterase